VTAEHNRCDQYVSGERTIPREDGAKHARGPDTQNYNKCPRASINAHVHLGNLAFDRWTNDAIPHYEAGLRVGELSLGDGFDGVLPWGRIHNRPFSDA
jgi:hypothetical protein